MVDTSIYGGLMKPSEGGVGGVIGTAKSALELAGQTQLGRIYQQAIDPNTGAIDPTKLMQLAPQAGILAPEIAAQAQARQQGIQAIDRQKMDNMRQFWGLAADKLTTLMDKPDLTYRDAADAVSSLLGSKQAGLSGLFGFQEAINVDKMLRGPDGKPLQGSLLRQALRAIQLQALGADKMSEYIHIGNNARGLPMYATRGAQLMYDASLPRSGDKMPSGYQGSVHPGGHPARPDEPPLIPQQTPSVGAPAAPVVGYTTGVAPGQQRAWESASQAGTELLNQGTSTAQAMRVSGLENMLADIRIAGDKFWVGAGNEAKLNTLAQRLGLWGISMDPRQVAAVQSMNKFAAQIAQQQATQMHATDAFQNLAMMATPSTEYSKLAADTITKMLLGNEDAIRIKANTWQEYLSRGGSPQDFFEWSRTFNTNFNPRVFQFARLDENQKKEVWDTMTREEQEKFARDLDYSYRRQWLARPKGYKPSE